MILSRYGFCWRWALALMTSVGFSVATHATSASPLQAVRVELAPAAFTKVNFVVHGAAENRVVFSAFTSTARIAAVALIDPAQRQAWRKTPAELGALPLEAARQPQHGDPIFLPEIRNASLGRWTLVIEREAPYDQAASLAFTFSVLERYGLNMVRVAPAEPAVAGQPMLLAVYPTDYGEPVKHLAAIEIAVRDAKGQTMARIPAVEFLRNPQGIRVSDEPGTYLAVVTFKKPGDYQLETTHVFREKGSPVKAHLDIALTPSVASLRLQDVQLNHVGTHCVRAVVFDFAVEVADAGTYVLDLLLNSKPPISRSVSATLSAGSGRIKLSMQPSTLLQMESFPTMIDRAALLRFDSTVDVVAEQTNIDLAGYALSPKAFCK